MRAGKEKKPSKPDPAPTPNKGYYDPVRNGTL